MKRFTCILLLFAGVLAQAQVRTYSENASKTFVVGLDSYFYGDAGSLSFEAAGQSFQASKGADGVFVGGQRLGSDGDVVIGISTSGNSENIVEAFEKAREMGVATVAMTGEAGGKMQMADVLLNVPSKVTPRIQESHILIGHIICELIEKEMFSK